VGLQQSLTALCELWAYASSSTKGFGRAKDPPPPPHLALAVWTLTDDVCCDHTHTQVLFKFNEAMRQLGSSVASLPAYGVGHSLGAVIHLILGSRYAVQRNSNVLLSVNSQELKDSVPLFMPVVSPITQRFAPVLAELSRSPLSGTVGSTVGQLKNQGPPIVKQLLPLMEQCVCPAACCPGHCAKAAKRYKREAWCTQTGVPYACFGAL
jgi:hypothetical protein